ALYRKTYAPLLLTPILAPSPDAYEGEPGETPAQIAARRLAELRALLERLTDHHEAGEPQPWRIEDAPDDHVEKLLRAIVGIEIAVEHVEGKFKLSQNHPERNRLGVIAGLRRRGGDGDETLAAWMAGLEEGIP
ncbi:FMN-binding negative transcriptional regulator, partial [Staphylococcus aureus]|uniref:FMN-binding negative transcriptional regulator n=1 Tax=Staphylococcus aureus TaxID=1280 RepID=UPI0039BEA4FA